MKHLRDSALIFCAALAAYWPALHGTPLWDDAGHITGPDLRTLGGLWRIWFEWGATQQYYPLLHSAFWLQHRLWGDSVVGYHLANVAFHWLASSLLVLILRRLAIPGALLAGLIFALHPVSVESVAWISEQKNTLSAVFYLGGALAFLRFDRSRNRAHYALALSLFVCALLTKTVTATLPAALLVVIWWQRGRVRWQRDVVPLAPWFAVAVLAGLLTVWFERDLIGATGPEFALTPLQRCLLAARAIWFYLGKILWPADLMFVYPRWTIDPSDWSQYLFPLGAVGLAASLVIVAKRNRAPLAGFLFFCGTLFPALGFFDVYPFRFSYVADHFQYLASLGIIVPVAAGLAGAGRRRDRRLGVRILCSALVVTLGVLTWRQSQVYANAETLYRHTIARNPGSWMAYLNLGTELANQKRLPEAIEAYRAALTVRPDYPEAKRNLVAAHYLLGNSLADTDARAAIREYEAALAIDPDRPELHLNLANALAEIPGRLPDAIDHYERAIRLQADYFRAHYNLGTVLMDVPGRHADAIAHLQTAVRIEPESPEAHVNLGVALAEIPGRSDEAIAHLQIALAKRPELEPVRELLGRLQTEAARK